LEASLATLVAQIEEMVPELDQDKKDIDATQAVLTEAEVAYQAKATALRDAKAKLIHAKNDMAYAAVEEQRAAWRAETARAVGGLSSGSGSGINVAVDAMTQTAQATRDRAAVLDMKAKALSGAKAAEEDPNIAAAMAAAAGTVANATVADRLAALQQRK
jgi:hypothetical protein